jgi:hypothetical protein
MQYFVDACPTRQAEARSLTELWIACIHLLPERPCFIRRVRPTRLMVVAFILLIRAADFNRFIGQSSSLCRIAQARNLMASNNSCIAA